MSELDEKVKRLISRRMMHVCHTLYDELKSLEYDEEEDTLKRSRNKLKSIYESNIYKDFYGGKDRVNVKTKKIVKSKNH